jgi:hypothetical protein
VDTVGGDEEDPVCVLSAPEVISRARSLAATDKGIWGRLNFCTNDAYQWAFYDRSRNHSGSRYPGISGAPGSSNAGTKTTTGVPNKDLGPVAGRLPLQGAQTSRKLALLDPAIPHPHHTGVPNKWPSLKLLQNGVFRVAFSGSFVFVFLVVLCCLKQQLQGERGGYLWRPIASS